MGLSRSRLFSVALEAYLRSREQEKMIEQLNQVYSEPTDPGKRRITEAISTGSTSASHQNDTSA
jgi:hypothetical protein